MSKEFNQEYYQLELSDGRCLSIEVWMTRTSVRTTEHCKIVLFNNDESVVTAHGKYYWYNRDWQRFTYHHAFADALEKLGINVKYNECQYSLAGAIKDIKSNIKIAV